MTMRIDFAKFAIPHDATNDELRDWINDLFTMWANTADLLAEYQEGEYVKVVRCRDCAYSIHFFHHDDERWQCAEPHQEGDDVKPNAYCWRGRRKEDGDG